MSSSPLLKEEYLLVSHHKKFKSKKHWVKLYKTSNTGKGRMELFESQKQSKSQMPVIMLIAGEFVKAEHKEDKPEFVVATRSDSYAFAAKSMHEVQDWTQLIQEVMNESLEEATINDVYEYTSSFQQQQRKFIVTCTKETESRLGIRGECKLIIEDGYIRLLSSYNDRYYKWCLTNIRRFGFTPNRVNFEAGSKSDSGEGNFSLLTTAGKEIHSLLSIEKEVAKERMKQQRGSETMTTSLQTSSSVPTLSKTPPLRSVSQPGMNSLSQESVSEGHRPLPGTNRSSQETVFEGHIYEALPDTNRLSQEAVLEGHVYEPITQVTTKPTGPKKPPRNSSKTVVPTSLTLSSVSDSLVPHSIPVAPVLPHFPSTPKSSQGASHVYENFPRPTNPKDGVKEEAVYAQVDKSKIVNIHKNKESQELQGHIYEELTQNGNEMKGNEKRGDIDHLVCQFVEACQSFNEAGHSHQQHESTITSAEGFHSHHKQPVDFDSNVSQLKPPLRKNK